MKLILDTHTLIWWWNNNPKLTAPARAAISDHANDVFVSAATVWEIATKHRIGKLPEAEGMLNELPKAMHTDGFNHLALNWEHSLLAGQFTHSHADPFDRMLAAQSQLENAVLITRDPAFAAFNIKTLW